MAGLPVKIFVYDISKGLARAWSMPLIGKQLDGVWHTGVVVYGEEFYFGGQGIESCQPGHTILGQPDQIYDMGSTHIPKEIFMDYLRELSSGTYRPETYSLFEHNCNNFSSEISQFLTGQEIPEYITNLPAEVLETPFGQMLRPMMDSVKVTPEGGSHVFSRDNSPANPVTPPVNNAATSSNGATNQQNGEESTHSFGTIIIQGDSGQRWIANVDFIKSNFPALRETMIGKLTEQELLVLDEFQEYILTPADKCTWSIGPVHVQLLCSTLLCHYKDLPVLSIQVILSILHQSVVRPEVVHVVGTDKTMSLIKVLTLLHKLPADTHQDVATLVTNASHSNKGHRWLTDTEKWPDGSSEMINCELVVFALTQLLRTSSGSVVKVASMALCNLACRKLSSEVAEKLGLCVTESLTKRPDPETAENCLKAWKMLLPYMEKSAMGRVDIKEVHLLHIAAQSKALNDLCVDIRRTMDRILNG